MSNFTVYDSDKILTVKHTIKKNLEEFLLTIQKLGKNCENQVFVSGGCTASLLQGESPKDYDVYFKSKSVADAVIELYTNDPAYTNEVAVYEEKYRDVQVGQMVITENAVTLKNQLQLIRLHYGTPEEIRKTFDFVHCLPYYDPQDDKIYISRDQYDCCVNKRLKVNNYSHLTTWREDKFKKKGYKYE